MKIFRIYSPNVNNRTIHYEGTPIIDSLGELEWTNVKEVCEETYCWDNIEQPYCDCPFIIGSVPVFPYSIIDVLTPLLKGLNIQKILIKVENCQFVILNTLEIVDGVLDDRKSKLTRFQDGRIMDVEKYVLKSQKNYPSMFKLKEIPIFTFVSEELYNTINKLGLSGISFEECKKNKSLTDFLK